MGEMPHAPPNTYLKLAQFRDLKALPLEGDAYRLLGQIFHAYLREAVGPIHTRIDTLMCKSGSLYILEQHKTNKLLKEVVL